MDSVLEDISYTPASLLNVFNSALTPSATKKIILLKGIYLAGRGVTYAGFFYDTLKDETTAIAKEIAGATATDFEIESEAGSSNDVYKLTSSDGEVTRSCTPADAGGCKGGSW